MICGTGLHLLQSSGEYPWAVCRTGVGNIIIYCSGCKLCVHKKCSGLNWLAPNPDYRCAWEMPTLVMADHRVKARSDLISWRWYLGDMLSAGGGCEITAWKKFRELLPVLSSFHLSNKTSGHVYSSCMRSAMLHASETRPLTKMNLQRNDRVMTRQICSIKPEDVATVRSS